MYPWEVLTKGLNFFWELSFTFDPDNLLSDYREINRRFKFKEFYSPWNPKWELLGLRTCNGDPLSLGPAKLYGYNSFKEWDFQWTEISKYTQYTMNSIKNLGCEVHKIRYSRLLHRGYISLHKDPLSVEHDVLRCHIPIITSKEAILKVGHQENPPMNPGSSWYVELTFPHYAWNFGSGERVTLLVDFDARSIQERYPCFLPKEYKNQENMRKTCLEKVTELLEPHLKSRGMQRSSTNLSLYNI